MWEIVSSLHRLQTRHGGPEFADWLKEVRPALRERTLSLTVRHLLLPLVPRAAYFPDFLTPAEGLLGLEAGIDAVMATPRERFRRELRLLQRSQGQSVWARGLACGEAEIRETLGRALRVYHRRAIAPYWPLVDACVVADRADRAQALRSGGIAALLESFWPTMRWRPPILEVDHPADRHIHLRGRGLLLIPSYFCWQFPVPLADPELPPCMVYPIRTELRRWGGPSLAAPAGEVTLARLLGRTRTAILRAAVNAGSTTDVSRRADVSLASVSQHMTVLRHAGLVQSARQGGSMLHTVTPLGHALLTGTLPLERAREYADTDFPDRRR